MLLTDGSGDRKRTATILLDDGFPQALHEHLKAHGYSVVAADEENLAQNAKRLAQTGIRCTLAADRSGALLFGEHSLLQDGLYLAVKLLARLVRLQIEGRTLQDLFSILDTKGESAMEYHTASQPSIPQPTPVAQTSSAPSAEQAVPVVPAPSTAPAAPPLQTVSSTPAVSALAAESAPHAHTPPITTSDPSVSPSVSSEDVASVPAAMEPAPTGRSPLFFSLSLRAEDPAGYLSLLLQGLAHWASGGGYAVLTLTPDVIELEDSDADDPLQIDLSGDTPTLILNLSIHALTPDRERLAVRQMLAFLDGYHRIDTSPLRSYLLRRR